MKSGIVIKKLIYKINTPQANVAEEVSVDVTADRV